MAFIKTRQVYRCSTTGETSENYIDVLPKELTLDPTYICVPFYNHHRTLFKEVTIVPWREFVTPEMQKAFKARIGAHRESKEQLLARIRAKLEQIILANWKPNLAHVQFHSSGQDSRMLSWLIRKLYRQRGDKWLGQMAFLCGNMECPYMRNILKYEGWKEGKHFYVINGKMNPLEYYKDYLLDFKNAWRWINGVQGKPQNLFWYLPEIAERQGILPAHYQTWTSQWGNTLFDDCSGPRGGRGLENIFRKFYLSQLCSRPKKGDEVIEPYTDTGLAHLVIHSSVRLGKGLRQALVASMDQRLAQFKRVDAHGDMRTIAGWILKKMLESYSKSWYSKIHPISSLPSTTRYLPAWSYWTAASLCEYLLEHDYKIKIAGSGDE